MNGRDEVVQWALRLNRKELIRAFEQLTDIDDARELTEKEQVALEIVSALLSVEAKIAV